jgi:hypothetical protein
MIRQGYSIERVTVGHVRAAKFLCDGNKEQSRNTGDLFANDSTA